MWFIFLRISHFGTVSLEDRVIVFGTTYSAYPSSPQICQYRNGRWNGSLGQLESPRAAYGAVDYEGIVMIVGGEDTQ